MQQNVQCSDENLREIILTIFAADNRCSSTGLRVGVLNGIVHLAGKVDSMEKREAAEELAKQVCGVRGVVNRIEAPGSPSPSRTINLDLNRSEEGRRIES